MSLNPYFMTALQLCGILSGWLVGSFFRSLRDETEFWRSEAQRYSDLFNHTAETLRAFRAQQHDEGGSS